MYFVTLMITYMSLFSIVVYILYYLHMVPCQTLDLTPLWCLGPDHDPADDAFYEAPELVTTGGGQPTRWSSRKTEHLDRGIKCSLFWIFESFFVVRSGK